MSGPARPRRSAVGRPRSESGWTVLAVGLLLGLVIAACAGVSGTPRPSPTTQATGSGPVSGPAATNWPTMVIEGAVTLAAADASFSQMNKDVGDAVNAGDPSRILTVMTDALAFLKANRVSVTYLQGYDTTKATGDKLAAAYDQMIRGAQAIVDALKSGNGPAVQQGFNDFFAGDAAYAEQTGPLGDIAAQAALMKRNLTQ